MADKLSKAQRSANMRRIKSKGTSPEMRIRRLVHSLGFRYRLHRKDLPGKPDLVFGPRRKVIFVHGCFWHQHTECIDGRKPKSNTGYWSGKLDRNVRRDAENQEKLKALGWDVLVIWECETSHSERLENRLPTFLRN